MSFGARVKARREALGLSRAELAERLGVSPSAISNYETGVSFPKEEVVLRLFDCLETDPNELFQDSCRGGVQVLTQGERTLLTQYRSLPPQGREAVRSVVSALCAYQDEVEQSRPEQEARLIPLYRCPAAAGYAAPVFGEDFDYIPVEDDVPQAAEEPQEASHDQEEFALKITVGDEELLATFEDNSSAEEFRELLEEGPITIGMEDYGGFEKVGPLGTSLSRNDTQITTQPGDVILYQGNQITIYYGTNAWNFTRLARIDDPSDLQEKLGEGTVSVTFSLA